MKMVILQGLPFSGMSAAIGILRIASSEHRLTVLVRTVATAGKSQERKHHSRGEIYEWYECYRAQQTSNNTEGKATIISEQQQHVAGQTPKNNR